jgi:hypothetical protein
VRKHEEAGATYIDVNAGARIGHERTEDRQPQFPRPADGLRV